MANIQISENLYYQLYLYFCDDDFQTDKRYNYIKTELEKKFQKMKNRQNYKDSLKAKEGEKEK